MIATIRGLLLDLLAGDDPARVHDAAESFLDGLTAWGGQSAPA